MNRLKPVNQEYSNGRLCAKEDAHKQSASCRRTSENSSICAVSKTRSLSEVGSLKRLCMPIATQLNSNRVVLRYEQHRNFSLFVYGRMATKEEPRISRGSSHHTSHVRFPSKTKQQIVMIWC